MKFSTYSYKPKRASNIAGAKRAGNIRKADWPHYNHKRFNMGLQRFIKPWEPLYKVNRNTAATSIQQLLQGAQRRKRIRSIAGLRVAAKANRTRLSRLPNEIINKIASYL